MTCCAGSAGQLRDEGAERVTLEVATDNDNALGLYESVGFVDDDRGLLRDLDGRRT